MEVDKKVAKARNIWRTIAMVVLVCVILGCAGYLWYEYYHRSQMEKLNDQLVEAVHRAPELPEVEEPEEPEMPYVSPIDWEELYKQNEHIYAWLSMPDVDIEYPVLRSGEDQPEDFYLGHNLDDSAGYPGCIYTQLTNEPDLNDVVTVVYGHNMKNGSMFHNLHEYAEEDFWKEHTTFTIYLPEGEKHYRIFAVKQMDNRLIPYYYHYFAEAKDLDDFLEDVAVQRLDVDHYDSSVEVDYDSHVVVLSTCTNYGDGRWLVIGVEEEND